MFTLQKGDVIVATYSSLNWFSCLNDYLWWGDFPFWSKMFLFNLPIYKIEKELEIFSKKMRKLNCSAQCKQNSIHLLTKILFKIKYDWLLTFQRNVVSFILLSGWEKVKAAFLLKRLEAIKTIFSDNLFCWQKRIEKQNFATNHLLNC